MRIFLKWVLALVAAGALQTAFTGPALLAAPATGENHAFIIGVGEYDHWPGLAHPEKDARALARVLTGLYDFKPQNVVLLTDSTGQKPTRDAIYDQLERYARTLTEKDNLLVFFSGISQTDEAGDTYWIPRDGKNVTRLNWLRHQDLVDEYFAAPGFKAKNVILLADSVFSEGLLSHKPNLLTVYDLRFHDRLLDKASRRSREVIASGRERKPEGEPLAGLSPFAEEIVNALAENQIPYRDFETLLFPALGARPSEMIRGRLKSHNAEGGQFTYARADLFPVVELAGVLVSPETGFEGDLFTFSAKTLEPAEEVVLWLDGRALPMEGEGTEWVLSAPIAGAGATPYSVAARNVFGRTGPAHAGVIETKKLPAELVAVAEVTVTPETDFPGKPFTVTAKTGAPAAGVSLEYDGQTLALDGEGTEWSLTLTPGDFGEHRFSVRAINEDKAPGPAFAGSFMVREPLVNVGRVTVKPDKAFSGDRFTITARTDRPARAVDLWLGDRRYSMRGQGTDWRLEESLTGSGRQTLKVVAANTEGAIGPAGRATVTLQERPKIPDVASLEVSPAKVLTKESFTIAAATNAPAAKAEISIFGKTLPMEGGPRKFTFRTVTETAGAHPYSITAANKEGQSGSPKTGTLYVEKRPPKTVVLEEASAMPDTVDVDEPVRFLAVTHEPAKSVTVNIDGEEFPMKSDTGTTWTLVKEFKSFGPKSFSVQAVSEDDLPSNEIAGAVLVRAELITIVRSFLEPGVIRPGGDLIITAITDRNAAGVDIWMGDTVHSMEGQGKKWTYRTKAPEDMEEDYKIVIRARNQEGRHGTATTWTISY